MSQPVTAADVAALLTAVGSLCIAIDSSLPAMRTALRSFSRVKGAVTFARHLPGTAWGALLINCGAWAALYGLRGIDFPPQSGNDWRLFAEIVNQGPAIAYVGVVVSTVFWVSLTWIFASSGIGESSEINDRQS